MSATRRRTPWRLVGIAALALGVPLVVLYRLGGGSGGHGDAPARSAAPADRSAFAAPDIDAEAPAADQAVPAELPAGEDPEAFTDLSALPDMDVFVRAADGRALARARVALSAVDRDVAPDIAATESRLEVGLTDADGHLRITWADHEEVWRGWSRSVVLVTYLPGHVPSQMQLPVPRPWRMDVVLAPAVSLPGRVRWASFDADLPVGRPVRVLAWPAGHRFEPGDLDPDREPRPPALACFTDHDGDFVLDGLDPALAYRIVASARGCVPVAGSTSLPPHAAGEALRLQVDRLHGCVLRLVEPGGRALRVQDQAFGPDGIGWSAHGLVAAVAVQPSDRDLLLAGVEPALLDARRARDAGVHALWLVAPAGLTECGPLACWADVPGYERGEARVWARAADAGLPESVLELQPRASAFGTLELVFEGAFGSGAGSTLLPPAATLVLFDPGGAPSRYAIPVVSSVPCKLTGVPAGEYRARLELANGFHGILVPEAPAPLRIDALHTETARFRLGAVGEIVCRVALRTGRPHAGPATFLVSRLQDGEPQQTRGLAFRDWPYFLTNLPAGRYMVAWGDEAMEFGRLIATVECEVVTDGVTSVAFTLP
jgi:hypothetical protein